MSEPKHPRATTAQPFGELLRELRLAAGLTQEELAERATLSLRGISDLERGVKTRPQRETIRLLAEALALSDADRTRFEDIARHRVLTGAPAVAEPLPWPTSLPQPRGLFFGREDDVERIVALLRDPVVRAVTITGFGGVGKTRLALEVTGRTASVFPDGATFVPLAAVQDPALVPAAIATALDITAHPNEPLQNTVLAALETCQELLILDNFEQVTAAASFVGTLLTRCPQMTVLVTSRVPLHLRGEREYALAPLPLPEQVATPQSVMDNAAVALFVARAQQAKPDFALTEANAPIVAAICVQLDGLPLAIELAAARVRLLPPATMAARLASRLSVLAGGTEALPARQRTMRDAIAWSYDLLEAREQRLLRLLSVCIGGCTVDAVEALWEVSDPTANVLGWINALEEKSLLRIEEHGDEVRLMMLEVIREFGAERLAADDDEATARHAHATYYRTLAEQARKGARGVDQVRWFEHLERETANFRAALSWARDHGEIEIGLRIAAMLWRYWYARAHYEEGQDWLDTFLRLDQQAGGVAMARTRAPALNGSAYFALAVTRDYARSVALNTEALALWRQEGNLTREADTLDALADAEQSRGDTARAIALFDESMAKRDADGDELGRADTFYRRGGLYQILGDLTAATQDYEACLRIRRNQRDVAGIAYVLHVLALIYRMQGDAGRAQVMLTESLEKFEQVGNRAGTASALTNLGVIAETRGDYARSTERHEAALAIFQEIGNREEIANTLYNLGVVALRQNDIPRASDQCERGLAISQELGDRRGIAFGLSFLGAVAEARGQSDHAAHYFVESLTICNALGSKIGIMDNLEALGRIATAGGYATEAARLFGAAAAIRSEEKIVFSPADAEDHDKAVASCCAVIGEEAFQAALAEGLALRMDAAVPEATAFIDTKSLAAAAERGDTLGHLARVFQRLAQGAIEREEILKQEVKQLHIEINQTKKAHDVAEIAESEFFQDLQERARRLRNRS